ncbi:MAG: carbohydrate ABC transporter permease [Chloroflexi bacterium]|nr:carbohydrate ABC transporter permease [Chloroflexota bacterium]MBV9132767.1 carbohydrate ABC transporter permease [Chloroflexota bacterium]MBV9897098.1 carbohydrate ABC transporter permease [Chloroflexota bacterium]
MSARAISGVAAPRSTFDFLGLGRWQRAQTLRILALAVYTVITVFPFYWMLITTFKQNSDLYNTDNNPLWFNAPPTFDNITYLLEQTRFLTWMMNSLIIGVGVVLITLITAVPAGYALARLRLPGAEQLGIIIFATYLVPPTLIFIPLTRVVHVLGLQNTIWSLVLVLPTISIPFSVWLLMGFFKNVPFEIEEAALVDGATRWQAVFRVVLPISRAGLAAAGMFAFAISLQAFLYPLVFTSSTAVKPVTLGVVTDLIRGDLFFWGSLMAGALLAGLPVAILFNYFLDDFVEGITAGATK